MGLFTDPMTLVDSAVADRIFNFRAQLNEPGSTVGEYIETAAAIAAGSKLVVKHTSSKAGIKRHLVQRTETFDLTADPTDGSAPVIVNLSISHSPLATESQIQNQLTLIIDAATEASFVANLTRELI